MGGGTFRCSAGAALFFTGHLIARWEGALFLALYAAYTTYLILAARQHDALDTFGAAMIFVVLPLVSLTLAILALREWRMREARVHSGA